MLQPPARLGVPTLTCYMCYTCYITLAALALPPAAAEEKGPERVPFLGPAEAKAKMTYAKDFQVTAFAAEPHLVQPFAFCFDDRGRIWIAENLNYQTRGSDSFKAGPKGRIAILEDTDGDGVFNRRKVFAEKIFFPSGLAIGHGGVWVGSPPNLLFFPDKNRDDRPDTEPQVVLDGWGRHDRHETLNSFLWGPDGWLYGCHGIFTHSRVGKPGTPDEQRVPINAGVWRYHPVKRKFEVFAWGTSNPWGLDFDDHGQAFVTACVIPHLFHMIQGGRYHRQSGTHFNPHVYNDIKTVADHRHKSAHGGARFYLADSFPVRFRGRLFMCNIHQHDIMTDVLERKGSGFVARHGDDFLQSNDPQWLGFNMEIGPEGALYVIDWHDQDICGRKVHHEETGRLWRIAYEGTKGVTGLDLNKKTNAELVRLHLHPNDWYVRQARRILHERATRGEVSKAPITALRNLLNVHPVAAKRLRALWTLHLCGGLSEELALSLLNRSSEYVQAWTIQLMCEDGSPSAAVKTQMVRLARETDSAAVRLYLASACQRLPVGERWDILTPLAARAEDKDDHNLPLMIWYALEPCVAGDRARALGLIKKTKIPLLARYIARRLTAKTAAGTGSSTAGRTDAEKRRPARVTPAAAVSSDGLVLWLRADWGVRREEGANAVARWTDRSSSSSDAAQPVESARPQAAAKLAGRAALRFDGEDDYLIIPHAERFAFSTGDGFSVAAWVHIGGTAQAGWRGIVAKSRERSPWYGIWIDPSRRWVFGGRGHNLAGTRVKPGWHHVGIVQDPQGARHLYVDGARVSTGVARDGNGPGDIWIGGAKSTEEYFRGGIGELRIYRRPLSHPEMAHLAANP